MPIADKAKKIAAEEVNKVAQSTQDAARSGAYLYPIKVSRHNSLSIVALTDKHRASFTSSRTAHYGVRYHASSSPR